MIVRLRIITLPPEWLSHFEWNCLLTSERVMVNGRALRTTSFPGGYFGDILTWAFAGAQDTLCKKLLTPPLVCRCCRTGCSWWNAPLTKLQCRRVAHGWLKEALTPWRVGINLNPFGKMYVHYYEKVLHWRFHKRNQHESSLSRTWIPLEIQLRNFPESYFASIWTNLLQ